MEKDHIPDILKKFKYYYYFNCNMIESNRVLLRNETLFKKEDVFIAWLRRPIDRKKNQTDKKWLYFRFSSIQQFYSECFLRLQEKYHRFYIIFSNPERCLYIDVDCIHNKSMVNYIKFFVTQTITSQIKLDYKCTSKDIYVWCNNRKINEANNKLSIHVISPFVYFDKPSNLKKYVKILRDKVNQKLVHLNLSSGIDENVYCNDYYQLWKLPENHDGDIIKPTEVIHRIYDKDQNVPKKNS